MREVAEASLENFGPPGWQEHCDAAQAEIGKEEAVVLIRDYLFDMEKDIDAKRVFMFLLKEIETRNNLVNMMAKMTAASQDMIIELYETELPKRQVEMDEANAKLKEVQRKAMLKYAEEMKERTAEILEQRDE